MDTWGTLTMSRKEVPRAPVSSRPRSQKRGINHPYMKNFVLARTTPLTRARKTLPSFEVTFKKLLENLEGFDVAKIRYEEIARSAIMAAPAS